MKRQIVYMCLLISMLLLIGCAVSPVDNITRKSMGAGNYQQAIMEYEQILSANSTLSPIRKQTIYNNLGEAYSLMNNFDKAILCWMNSASALPERAYWAYGNISQLYYRYGHINEAYSYAKKAKELANSPKYFAFERNVAERNQCNALEEMIGLQLLVSEMKSEYDFGNYSKAINIGNNIILGRYHVFLGIGFDGFGNTISAVTAGSIGDLSGFEKRDVILKVGGKPVTSSDFDAANTVGLLYDKYGATMTIVVRRNGRMVPINCSLVYPEVERARSMLQASKEQLAQSSLSRKREEIQPPRILVLEPRIGRGVRRLTSESYVNIVILASDNVGVRDVHVNGAACMPSEASTLEKTLLPGYVKKYSTSIAASNGKNSFQISAINTRGVKFSQQIEVEVNRNEKPAEKIYDHRIAVVIGINNYSSMPTLEYAVNDAKSVQDRLSKMGFNKIIELYDKDATRARILRILADELPGTMEINDGLVVYFAGHGTTETLSGGEEEGYIMPADGDSINDRGTGIAMTYIRDMITRYRAKHILFVFDSCYSGLGLKRGGGTPKAVEGFIKAMSQKRAAQIITAGGKDEQAAEAKGHGVFTGALINALDGKDGLNQNGYILASDIGQMVRKKVSQETNFRQNPLFGWLDGEGDFIFETP